MTKPTILISLIGHQPLPTLLAVRRLQPTSVILLGTSDERINEIRTNLAELITETAVPNTPEETELTLKVIPSTVVDPWNILSIGKRLSQVLRRHQNATLICDVTGGTKAMSIGLTQYAREKNAEVIYIDSETLHTHMWRYQFVEGNLQLKDGSPESIPSLLSISDLFRMYLGHKKLSYKIRNDKDRGAWFERDVKMGFQSLVDCLEQSVTVSGNEEADLVLRMKNRFALVECKAIKNFNMDGVKQLNNMASDRYLGLYTGKILAVCLENRDSINRDQRIMAEQHNIQILELSDWNGTEQNPHIWSESEKKRFQDAIDAVFSKA